MRVTIAVSPKSVTDQNRWDTGLLWDDGYFWDFNEDGARPSLLVNARSTPSVTLSSLGDPSIGVGFRPTPRVNVSSTKAPSVTVDP